MIIPASSPGHIKRSKTKMQEQFFLFGQSDENVYTLSSTIDNFRLEAELEDGREFKLVTCYSEGITLQELDELKNK